MYPLFILVLFIFGHELSAEGITDKFKCITAINKNYKSYNQCSDKLKTDLTILKATICSSMGQGCALEAAKPPEQLDCECDGDWNRGENLFFLKDWPDWLLGNKDFVIAAMPHFSAQTLRWISNALLDDRDVAEAATANFGFVDLSDFLKHLSPRLKDDKTFAQLAVKVDPMYLAYVSDRLKDDKEIVLEAVNQHPSVMKFASARLKDDLDVVQVANRYRGSFTDFHTFWDGGPSFEFVSDRLKDDKNMALQAVSAYPPSFEFVSDRLKDDEELARLAVTPYPEAFKFVSKRLKDDRDFVYLAISGSEHLLQYASERLRDDLNLVKNVLHSTSLDEDYHVQTNGDTSLYGIQYTSDRLYNHPELTDFRKRYENKKRAAYLRKITQPFSYFWYLIISEFIILLVVIFLVTFIFYRRTFNVIHQKPPSVLRTFFIAFSHVLSIMFSLFLLVGVMATFYHVVILSVKEALMVMVFFSALLFPYLKWGWKAMQRKTLS
ncbi:MAG: DUF4116 domain-containing protein [Candidatus Marinamargulisbacteria bacterium]